jgi:redox-sensitive bicupin YhaK (pirin superfamily)
MSNVEARPEELRCDAAEQPSGVEVLMPREVPLGGPRAMTVRRTLPQRGRTFVGAWCFADHYGPDDVAAEHPARGMNVPPHPHCGLQTASWLFRGDVEHRDSLGTRALIRPGELNLMTGGYGICHSEVSTERTTVLHGVQLWIALPHEHRDAARDFRHYAPPGIELAGATARVFLGELAGSVSPVPTFTPLLGVELRIEPHATVELSVDPRFEHGLLADCGDLVLDGRPLQRAELGVRGTGQSVLRLVNKGESAGRALLLGGTPFRESIVMWWNFVGRSHADIVAARDEWQRESERFGRVEDFPGARLPAPPLPNATLAPRRNR